MALLNASITEPSTADIEQTFTVSGAVDSEPLQDGEQTTVKSIDWVHVTVGAAPTLFGTATGPASWQCQASVPDDIQGGELVNISVDVQARVESRFPTGSRNQTLIASISIQKTFKKEPELTVLFAPSSVANGPLYPFEFSGTASNGSYGITSVKFSIDNGPWEEANNLSGNWSNWHKIKSLAPGSYKLSVEATGGAPYFLKKAIVGQPFVIRTPFEPTAVEQVFANTTYLRELLDFAARHVRIGGGPGPTPGDLAARFLQPFDKLTQPRAFEQVTRPVSQVRLAIEVLRRHLNPAAPAELDQQFRIAAYRTLLREFGSSLEELRLARLADPSSRQALATRLGLELEASRPDQLDRLTLEPDSLSDAQLADLFGYQPPLPSDPLQAPPAMPKLALWRANGLRQLWLRDDIQSRDGAAGYLPIIDPDLIDASHILNQAENNPPYKLWLMRNDWLTVKLAEIAQTGAEMPDPLTRFDAIVRQHIGADFDLAELAVRDANGEELDSVLALLYLDLAAFRQLVRSRALLSTGQLLAFEWQEIYGIVLQVKKSRQFQTWRAEEQEIPLDPALFDVDGTDPTREIPRWRGSRAALNRWRRILRARTNQKQGSEEAYREALVQTERQILPALRDALLALAGQTHPPKDGLTAAESLGRKLMIDFQAHAEAETTAIDHAIETLQAVLFSVRAGAEGDWSINEAGFDAEWQWMGGYRTWLAAMRVFAYPENQLFPNLYVGVDPQTQPSQALAGPDGLLVRLRKEPKPTPASIRSLARDYIARLRQENALAQAGLPADFVLTDRQLSAGEQTRRQDLIEQLFIDRSDPNNPHPIIDPNAIPQWLREVFWLAPIALAQRLQEQREYLAALDWYQTVYAFDLPQTQRKRYPGLRMEASLTTSYGRTPAWLAEELNPHIIVRTSLENGELVGRRNAYCRFTLMAIVRCFSAYADQEFSQGNVESRAKARGLYLTALDLLSTQELRPETGPEIDFPANPVWEILKLHAEANLAKIHNGMNIAGVRDIVALTDRSAATFLPSQYRYAFLVERAKQFIGIAQQLESAYLSALERRDAENYSLMQANRDLQIAGASFNIAELKVSDAVISEQLANLQKEKSEIQEDFYRERLDQGLIKLEEKLLSSMVTAQVFQGGAGFWSALGSLISPTNPFNALAAGMSIKANWESANAQIYQTRATFERRKQEWRLQHSLAEKDTLIGEQHILQAKNQVKIANWENYIAEQQLIHATAVVDFLANKFTNAELFEWMSGVLGSVYAYFLQQASALGQLAEAQLAFERQEASAGLIQADYWSDNETPAAQSDRRGLTGSARLLQDVYRLDQYALETSQRKLHLSQTLSLAQLDPQELQTFRETGVLTFSSPEALFDQDFPGHYLRLIKRVKVSLIALTPPTRGVRASLSASGFSRAVVGGETFAPVTLARVPETVAFTSPLNASGLFELEPDNGMLLPFEGMGLDASWRLEMPKPANPFDYRTIADVLLTVEYTALYSYDYRQTVIRRLDRISTTERAFSVRDLFADSWYELNHPEQVGADRQMQVNLSIRRDDFPPHVSDLRIQQITLFCVRAEGVLQEIKLVSLAQTIPGLNTVTAGEVLTQGGIVGTRRPGGAPWQVLVGRSPIGDWMLQLENTAQLKRLFQDESILDLVLMLTVTGETPAWPA